MRILLDEMMSRKLARELTGHDVSTVQSEGWAGLTNGALLDAIAGRFDVFITMDTGIRYQQRLVGRSFGIIELRAGSNSIRALKPAIPRLQAAIATIQPGEVVTITASPPDVSMNAPAKGEQDLTIREAQRRVDAWISQYRAGYWPPLANLARLIEETGELARLLNHLEGHKPKKSDEAEQDLALELADIIYTVICIANSQNIDLDDAFRRVLQKVETRDANRYEKK